MLVGVVDSSRALHVAIMWLCGPPFSALFLFLQLQQAGGIPFALTNIVSKTLPSIMTVCQPHRNKHLYHALIDKRGGNTEPKPKQGQTDQVVDYFIIELASIEKSIHPSKNC